MKKYELQNLNDFQIKYEKLSHTDVDFTQVFSSKTTCDSFLCYDEKNKTFEKNKFQLDDYLNLFLNPPQLSPYYQLDFFEDNKRLQYLDYFHRLCEIKFSIQTEERKKFYLLSTCIYLEYGIPKNFNHLKLLSITEKNEFLSYELMSGGVTTYQLLKDKITPEDFSSISVSSNAKLNNPDYYDFKSYLLLQILTKPTKEIEKYTQLYNILEPEIFKAKSHIFTPKNIDKMQYFNLKLLTDFTISEKRVRNSLLNYQHITLIEATKINHMLDSFEKCVFRKKNYGLDHKQYTNIHKLIIHFQSDLFLSENMVTILKNKSKLVSKKSPIWNYILIEMTTAKKSVSPNTKKMKI